MKTVEIRLLYCWYCFAFIGFLPSGYPHPIDERSLFCPGTRCEHDNLEHYA